MLTIEELEHLNGSDYITYNLGNNLSDKNAQVRAYRRVLAHMARASTGRKREMKRQRAAKSIRNIRRTNPNGVYIICINGVIRGFPVNLKLMASKKSNYFLAIFRKGAWVQVLRSEKWIEGVKTLPFDGNYGGAYGGIEAIKIGYEALLNALIQLEKGSTCPNVFLTVVMNLFEASRYYDIADAVIYNWTQNIPIVPYYDYLIHNWGSAISVSVRGFQENGQWELLPYKEVTDLEGRIMDANQMINEATVASKLRICKCDKTDSGEVGRS